jgi:membrane-associated protease RseP (regulator of RpoE activity)
LRNENGDFGDEPRLVEPLGVEPMPELTEEMFVRRRPRRRRVWLPLGLFVATCLSTFLMGGWEYALAVMTILVCHEMGHFIQAWRYGVYASFPYFIPLPNLFGTLGAVIAMDPRKGDRRALFDIGITGPLAGLVPTLIFLVVGLSSAQVVPINPNAPRFGDPLIVQILYKLFHLQAPPGFDVGINAFAFAGWVGLFITSLNLIPIGQLDGGHILYALLRDKARIVGASLLIAATAVVGVFFATLWTWTPMLGLLIFVIGPLHPPTEDDSAPLGWFRIVLGWLVLAFIPLGFTPVPILPPP